MGRVGQEACANCTHSCRLFHQTEQTSSPTSFFKIIVTQDYFTTLSIPPAFSRTVPDLINKEIILNDSSGQHWPVKVSKVHDSLAFVEGWDGFSLGHGLKVGYLLVFNYIQDLHFDVKIYDTSACEKKLDFSKQRTRKKRIRGRSGSPVKDDMLARQGPNALVVSKLHGPKMKNQHSKVDLVVTQNSKESGQLMFPEQHEDPCYPASLEFDQSHGVDGTMKIASRDSKVSNVDYGTHGDQNGAILRTKDISELGRDVSDISEFEMDGRNASPCETNKITRDKISTSNLETNKKMKAIMSNREVQEYQFSEALDEPKKLPLDMTPQLCSSMDELNATGEETKKLKEEHVPLDGLKAATGLPKETMGEFGHGSDMFNQDNESHFKTTPTPSCVVSNYNDCHELSASLPLPRKVSKVNQSDKKVIVLLRDPQQRLWPVFYHEQPHLKLLGHGWLDFSRANNIQPEDEFLFEAEPEAERKFKRINILDVRIVSK